MFGGGFVKLLIVESFGEPGCVEAEVDADVTVLVEAGVVELRAKAEDTYGGELELPEGIESCGFVLGIDVCVEAGGWIGGAGDDFGSPEIPAHLELVSHVVVELLGGFSDGVFDDGAGGVLVFFGAVVVDVDALVGGGFGEADGIDARRRNALFAADEGELAHHRDHGRREGFEAEVREPEAKVELIGHSSSLDLEGGL